MKALWTPEQDAALSFHWGVFRPATIAHRLGRPTGGVIERAKKLQLGSPSRGTVTVRGLARKTGYDKTQIRNAVRILEIDVGRRTTTMKKASRHTAIDELDAERIIEFLGARPGGTRIRFQHNGAWGEVGRGGHQKPDACVACGTKDRPHYAKDHCRRCYDKAAKIKRKKNRSGTGLGC